MASLGDSQASEDLVGVVPDGEPEVGDVRPPGLQFTIPLRILGMEGAEWHQQ